MECSLQLADEFLHAHAVKRLVHSAAIQLELPIHVQPRVRDSHNTLWHCPSSNGDTPPVTSFVDPTLATVASNFGGAGLL